jgi:hypothetical protein
LTPRTQHGEHDYRKYPPVGEASLHSVSSSGADPVTLTDAE